MMTPRRFHKRAEQVEAIQFTDADSGRALAIWTGGTFAEFSKPSDPSDVFLELLLPSVGPLIRAHVGNYVVRSEDGKFSAWSYADFHAAFEGDS